MLMFMNVYVIEIEGKLIKNSNPGLIWFQIWIAIPSYDKNFFGKNPLNLLYLLIPLNTYMIEILEVQRKKLSV